MNEFEIGLPRYFDVNLYLDAVESMICADEIKFAISMLDNLPGYYRDHVPARAKDIRSRLYGQCMTVQDYINDREELIERSEVHHKAPIKDHWRLPHFSPRGELIVNIVRDLNAEGFCVNIVELGPYNYWLPIGLADQNLDFIYTPISINPHVKSQISTKTTSDKPIKNIFICFEVIEHLWFEDEIVHYFYKTQMDPDFVLISTPKYTCGNGLFNWDSRVLGHIRTWTPGELTTWCRKHWPDLDWFYVDSQMMVMVGQRKSV